MATDISSRLVAISGVTLNPQPSALICGLQDIQSSDAGRTESGKMVMTIIATKRKLSFTFSMLSAAETAEILSLMDEAFFPVTYFDTRLNARTTKTFYKGDRSSEWYNFNFSNMEFKSLTFDLIEQ